MTRNPASRAGASEGVGRAMDALRKGRIVMIADPVRPQRGAVLAVPADRAYDDVVNFMANHARGLVAVALPSERIERLGLSLQAEFTRGLETENYTISIEAREGVSTGISAADRAQTIQVLADARTRADELVSPGHVFPARAHGGGVLTRPGWAEACVDLARIAGQQPVMAFCEVLGADGELATGDELDRIAESHGVPRVGIAEILAHRLATETFVKQLTQTTLPTRWGDFVARVFVDQLEDKKHLALTLGEVRSSDPILARVHSECLTGDVFGSLRCDCGSQLGAAMSRIREEGRGTLLYLRQEGRGIGLVSKVDAYGLQDAGRDTVEANLELGFEADQRDFGIGAQMLLALGVQRVRLLTNNPRKVHDLTSYGIEVMEREPLELTPCSHNEAYLKTKKEKMGHLLTKV